MEQLYLKRLMKYQKGLIFHNLLKIESGCDKIYEIFIIRMKPNNRCIIKRKTE
jgi:hypothetical protein